VTVRAQVHQMFMSSGVEEEEMFMLDVQTRVLKGVEIVRIR
jgi:hypothetical protein